MEAGHGSGQTPVKTVRSGQTPVRRSAIALFTLARSVVTAPLLNDVCPSAAEARQPTQPPLHIPHRAGYRWGGHDVRRRVHKPGDCVKTLKTLWSLITVSHYKAAQRV